MGSFHSEELDSVFLAMPGIKALYPSTAQDAFDAIGEDKDVGRTRDDHFIAEHANTKCGVDVVALVKSLFFVRDAVPIGIFENNDAIAFRPERRTLAQRVPVMPLPRIFSSR